MSWPPSAASDVSDDEGYQATTRFANALICSHPRTAVTLGGGVRRDYGGRGGQVRTAREHRKTPCGQRRASGEGCDATRSMLSLPIAGGMCGRHVDTSHGRLGALAVLHVGHSVRLQVASMVVV